jgi:hypothetical protein
MVSCGCLESIQVEEIDITYEGFSYMFWGHPQGVHELLNIFPVVVAFNLLVVWRNEPAELSQELGFSYASPAYTKKGMSGTYAAYPRENNTTRKGTPRVVMGMDTSFFGVRVRFKWTISSLLILKQLVMRVMKWLY